MGVLDIPRMMAKAREAQNKAKAVEAAGKHDSASFLTNGLIDWVEDAVNTDIVMEKAKIAEEHRDIVQKVIDITRKDLKAAFGDAKKQLQKEMQSNMNMDDIADMFKQGA